MKKIILLTLALTMIFFAVSCGGEKYKNDVAPGKIAEAVDEKISNGSTMVAADDLFLSSFDSAYTPLIAEYAIKYTSSSTLFDEYGIIKVDDPSNTSDIVKMIESYKNMRVDADMGYLPGELPKIKNAKTKVCGNYVMYAFLSDADSDAAFAAFEEALK